MSSSPLNQKLRVKDNYRIAVVNAPSEYRQRLEPLPNGVDVSETLNGTFDLIWYFTATKADLDHDLPKLRQCLNPSGILWLSYPKGTSGIETDLKRDVLVDVARGHGAQAVAQIAVDETWSAIRFKAVD